MISPAEKASLENARRPNGEFGNRDQSEAPEVKLTSGQATQECGRCGAEDDDDINPDSGRCDDCHTDSHCGECGDEYESGGDGYDGKCGGCADADEPGDERESNTVSVFDFADERIEIDHSGGDSFSLYNEDTNECIGHFDYYGDHEDHENLEHAAKDALKELDPELHRKNEIEEGGGVDLSMFSEEDQTFPLSLYAAGGLEGDFEPYNGDIHVEDGALRYWREELEGEVVIGKKTDGTYLVAYEDEDSVRFTSELSGAATPAEINGAIKAAERQALAEAE